MITRSILSRRAFLSFHPPNCRNLSIASQLAASTSATDPATDESTIQGWVRSCRRQKHISFAVINDGSNVDGIQAVVPKGMDERLTVGSSVRMRGTLVDSPSKGQSKEFRAASVELVGESDAETYPIPNTKQGIPAPILRRNAHFRPRTTAMAAMLRLRSEMEWAVTNHFREKGFVNVQTPLITSSDCEGAGEVFRVETGTPLSPEPPSSTTTPSTPPPPPPPPLYLTVSSQLHLEALSSSLAKVYTLSPAFRAENSDTARHLQEFWMLEAEISFLSSNPSIALESIMRVVENSIKAIAETFHVSPSSKYFYSQTVGLEEQVASLCGSSAQPFTRMEYSDAVTVLKAHAEANPTAFRFQPSWGASLQTEHEKWLAEEFIQGPVFVINYPTPLKPFYMLQSPSEGTSACFDLLVPRLGELVGGSLREYREKELLDAMKVYGIDPKHYDWYVDLRKFGSTPHGGFGMGWERLVAWLTGTENVRDCIAFPRAAEGSRF